MPLEKRYSGTNIFITPSLTEFQFGYNQYVAMVTDHLLTIENKIGLQFMLDLTNTAKPVKIKNPVAPRRNQIEAGNGGYVKLRSIYERAINAHVAPAEFATELRATLARAGRTAQWLADRLSVTRLPTWRNFETVRPNWWVNPPLSIHQRPVYILPFVNGWLSNAPPSLPNFEQMDALLLILRDHLERGPGTNSFIMYNPLGDSLGNESRPAPIGLFHELVHAYYSARGEQLGTTDSSSPLNGGRFFEIMSVGMSPYDTAPYSENRLRQLWPHGLRNEYRYQ